MLHKQRATRFADKLRQHRRPTVLQRLRLLATPWRTLYAPSLYDFQDADGAEVLYRYKELDGCIFYLGQKKLFTTNQKRWYN